jgi:hypothetical protein
MKPEDVGYLIVAIAVALVTIIALTFVLGVRILKNEKYTRLIAALLALSLSHTIANPIMYYCFTGTPYYGWAIWVVSLFGNGTAIMLLLAQVELLGVFSTLCHYWSSRRVFLLKVLTVILQVAATLPSYIYPVVFYLVNRNTFGFFMTVSFIDSSGCNLAQPFLPAWHRYLAFGKRPIFCSTFICMLLARRNRIYNSEFAILSSLPLRL